MSERDRHLHLSYMGRLEKLKLENDQSALQYLQADQPKLAREAIMKSEGILDSIHAIGREWKRWKEDND